CHRKSLALSRIVESIEQPIDAIPSLVPRIRSAMVIWKHRSSHRSSYRGRPEYRILYTQSLDFYDDNGAAVQYHVSGHVKT
ncbi:MAG TPA: hypothetical protein VKD24_00960, partial [Candidatus Angelobacter sp.]|nr:hypothetical protein [Candidatus Angelobacter sp.]